MKSATKLTLSVSFLVLLVVVAVDVVYFTGLVRRETQGVYQSAYVLENEIYNQMNAELLAASAAGTIRATQPGARTQFLQQLHASQPLATLMSSGIGYNTEIRDVALVAPSGIVTLDSDPLLEGRPQPNRQLLTDIMHAGLWPQIKAIFGPEAIYAVNLATQVGNKPLATISIGVDTVLLRQAMIGSIEQSLFEGALVVLLATGLAWGLSDTVLSKPLSRIRQDLERIAPAAASFDPKGNEFGAVSSKIEFLGREMEGVRQGYTQLQLNLQSLLEGMEEGLLLFDSQARIVMASAATPRLLGTSSDLVGQSVESVFPGTSNLDRAVRLAVRQQEPMPWRDAERHPGGQALLAKLELVPEQQGRTGCLLTLRDAEAMNKLEREREVARRLAAIGRLSRGVAHEVKNPLNAMAIHLDLLREKAGPTSNGLDPHLRVMRHTIDRLDRVVRNFLDFHRPIELKLVLGDLSEVVHNVVHLVRPEAEGNGIEIVLRTPDSGPHVWLDRDQVEQALLNVVKNGIQAMRTTAVEAAAAFGSAAVRRNRTLEIEVFSQHQQGLVRVRDHGAGIPPENREKIFDLYFTTKSEGSGIGLAEAARTMHLHRGNIEVEDTPTPGASFLLRFPLAHREAGVA